MVGGTPKRRVVHGDDLLYRFLNQMLREDDERYQAVPRLMVQAMAIWLPLEVYREVPVLLPWVVRDPSCRGNKRTGAPDEWGAPDERGYQRDDNSLIKGIPRSLEVHSPVAERGLRGARMGTEFVAAHIWREVNWDGLASRHPLLNSFVPNLVWLPGQIAKLSDREGGAVQQVLQSMAWSIYRDAPVAPHLKAVVEEAWSLIPHPSDVDPVDPRLLNQFVATDRFIETRRTRIRSVVDALESLEAGSVLTTKVVSTRFTVGLPGISAEARAVLLTQLRRFNDDDDQPSGT